MRTLNEKDLELRSKIDELRSMLIDLRIEERMNKHVSDSQEELINKIVTDLTKLEFKLN